MANKDFIMALAKTIIATSWVDGEVNHDEINCLKDLLFQLDELSGRDWAALEMYIESPVDDHERRSLVDHLVKQIHNSADQDLALETLQKVIAADGMITNSEAEVAVEIKTAIEGADIGVFEKIQGFFQGAVGKRKSRFETQHGRCIHLEDYLLNKVYYGVKRRRDGGEEVPDIAEDRLRKLCLAAGLMARVAKADEVIDPAERDSIAFALKETWDLDQDEAFVVTRVALREITPDVDYYRLTRNFYASTTENERKGFLDLLFAIGAADGMVSKDEMEEIHNIAKSLKLSQRDFVYAKNKIAKSNRAY